MVYFIVNNIISELELQYKVNPFLTSKNILLTILLIRNRCRICSMDELCTPYNSQLSRIIMNNAFLKEKSQADG